MNKKQVMKWWESLIDEPTKEEYPYRSITKNIKVPKELQLIKCNGSSLWGNTKNLIIKIKNFDIRFDFDNGDFQGASTYILIFIKHNSKLWEIYTDEGFERGCSKVLSKILGEKVKIGFTEQGMQEEYIASLENNGDGIKLLGVIFKKEIEKYEKTSSTKS